MKFYDPVMNRDLREFLLLTLKTCVLQLPVKV